MIRGDVLMYNIRPDIACLPFLLVFYLFLRFRYRTTEPMRISFRVLTFVVLVSTVIDAISLYAASVGRAKPQHMMGLTYVCCAACFISFFVYLRNYLRSSLSRVYPVFISILVILDAATQIFLWPGIRVAWFICTLLLYVVFLVMELPVIHALEDTVDALRTEKERSEEASKRILAAAKAKSSFLTFTSDALRTPMNAITDLNALMIEEAKKEDDGGTLELALTMEEAARGLMETVEGIQEGKTA